MLENIDYILLQRLDDAIKIYAPLSHVYDRLADECSELILAQSLDPMHELEEKEMRVLLDIYRNISYRMKSPFTHSQVAQTMQTQLQAQYPEYINRSTKEFCQYIYNRDYKNFEAMFKSTLR